MASVSCHILCPSRTWTIWRWLHPGVNINWFKQRTTAQDHGHIQGVQEAAGPCLSGVGVHGAHFASQVLPQDLESMHMGSYLSVCGRSAPAHPERPKSLDAQVPNGNRICTVPTHPLVHVQLCPDSSLVVLWCLGNNRTHACSVQTRSFC